ncbi:MAG: FAD-binding oxidoreductase [Planctomycetes bacterium]|nr:FAD-binding oxidoreductase [Planctomycetota bacterium]
MATNWPAPTTVTGYGFAQKAHVPVVAPDTVDALAHTIEQARQSGTSIGLRGAGRSYGDAALNSRGIIVDLRRLNRIRSADWSTGVLRVEPGVTIEQLWREGLVHGFWPAVVPGTMFPTIGGCVAMNVHGKNNFKVGTVGDATESFELLCASGERLNCSRTQNADVFRAAIGGFGMLGVFTELTLKLKRVATGDLMVTPLATANIADMVSLLAKRAADSDYMVGWVDMLGSGAGLVHVANYCTTETGAPGSSLHAAHQDLPSRLFGLVPKRWMWPGLWCALTKPGMRAVNSMKLWSGARHARAGSQRQSLVGFSFLLDYVPHWRNAYLPGGFLQYQSFVPRAAAASVFEEQRLMAKREGIQPYLGVMKLHRPDEFLLTHAVDGYSLALDFPIAARRTQRMQRLTTRMNDCVLGAGGRFYPAKDSVMDASVLARYVPPQNLQQFLSLKQRLDPQRLFCTDFSQRALEPLFRTH